MEGQFIIYVLIFLVKELIKLVCLHQAVQSGLLPQEALDSVAGSYLIRFLPTYCESISVSRSIFTEGSLYRIYTSLTNLPLTPTDGSIDAIWTVINMLMVVLAYLGCDTEFVYEYSVEELCRFFNL